MAAAANIVLADALATPVNHTFIPQGPDADGVWWYEDQSGASPIGYNRISCEFRKPKTGTAGESSANRTYRVKIGLHTPKLENTTNSTVSGVQPAPTLSYIPRCFIEFVVPERSALQDRKDLRKFAQFLVADTAIINLVESLQHVW